MIRCSIPICLWLRSEAVGTCIFLGLTNMIMLVILRTHKQLLYTLPFSGSIVCPLAVNGMKRILSARIEIE